MSARDEVLERIRTALADRPRPAPAERTYRRAEAAPADLAAFVERLRDYRAVVREVAAADLARTIDAVLAEHAATRVVAAPGLPPDWAPTADRGARDIGELDRVDAVVTGCAVAIAETATIVLDHDAPDQGRRAITLVPDLHVVVVRADQVVAGVPDAVATLAAVRTQTWISGPSATSDIELERVEGVHGPRRLVVLLVRG
jgi:L-lactate dehydrogenase complex protein LldG